MSADSREFAEAASMAMQHFATRPVRQDPEINTLLLLSLAYSMIEIAESFTRLVNAEAEVEVEVSDVLNHR